MANTSWDRPSDHLSTTTDTHSAFDANRNANFRLSELNDAPLLNSDTNGTNADNAGSSSFSAAFQAPSFAPPPSFDSPASTSASHVHTIVSFARSSTPSDELEREERAVADLAAAPMQSLGVSVSDLGASAIDVVQSVSVDHAKPPVPHVSECEQYANTFCVGFVAYILGIVAIALFVYGCTATAYMYSYRTTLSVWLGVFLPCTLCCIFLHADSYKYGVEDYEMVLAFFAGTTPVGLLVGLVGGIYFLGPWWMLAHLGTARNVDAAALDFINNGTQPTSGIFHFQPSTFVNQERYGYFALRKSDVLNEYYCTAPLVSSSTQARVVYWVTDYGSCCSSNGTSCWNAASSPGSVDGAYLQVRRPEYIDSSYSDARVNACARLAALNSTYSAASICSLPTVYLTLDSSPEATRDSLYSKGMTYVGVMTGLWPLVLGVMAIGCYLASVVQQR